MLKGKLVCVAIWSALVLPALAEKTDVPRVDRVDKAALVRSVNHKDGITEIVIHDRRPRKTKTKAVAAPARANANFQEISVQAPRLEAVPRPAGRVAEVRPVWTQDYEPGPASQAAANIGPSWGVNIMPTQAYYYGPGYGPYSPIYYGPGAGGFSPGRHRRSWYR